MNPFLLGVFISRLGDAFSFLAMILLLTKGNAGNWLVSLFMVAHYLPGVLIGIWGRQWFDRISKKRVIIVTYLVSAGLTFTAIFSVKSPLLLLTVSTLLGITYGIYVPLQKALIAEIFASDEIRHANASAQMAEVLAKTLGFVLAGVIFHQAGPRISFFLDAISFVGIAALITSTPLVSRETHINTASIDTRYDPTFELISLVFALTWLGTGSLFALEAGYARAYLHASETTIGWLFSSATFGSFLIPYFLSHGKRLTGLRPLAWVCLSEIFFVAIYGVSSSVLPAIALIIAYGCSLTARHILLNSWVHERIPQSQHGSAFARQQGQANLMMMTGMGLSGPLAELIGVRTVILGASLAGLIGIALAFRRYPFKNKSGNPFRDSRFFI